MRIALVTSPLATCLNVYSTLGVSISKEAQEVRFNIGSEIHLKSILYVIFLSLSFLLKAQNIDPKAKADSVLLLFQELNEKERSTAFIETFSRAVIVDLEAANTFANTINEYAFEKKDTFLLASAEVLFAEYHWRKSEYQKGIERALAAIALAETDKRFQTIEGQALLTVGSIQFFSGNSLKAIEYYKEAAEVFDADGNIQAYISVVNNIGAVYADYGDKEEDELAFDSALLYLNKVIELKGVARYNFYLSAIGNSAYIYVAKKEYEKAKELYDLWEAEEAKTPNVTSRASQYVTIGTLYTGLGDYTKAERYLLDGLNYAMEINAKQRVVEYYDELAILMERKRDFEQALGYSKNAWQLKDSLFNLEKVNAINELETKYQSAKKEQEIQAANATIDQNKRFQQFLTIVIILIVVFSVVAFLMLRQRFRLRRELLSQEIDTLRAKINSIFGGGIENLNLTLDQINDGLYKPLSDREYEILSYAVSDQTNSEIADSVYLSVNTVKTHLKNIYTKLGVSNRKEALEMLLAKS